MGHNLEKNLRKIEGFRAKGQLEKALKQLQDWARKHPDTPHYLYEAAMVAFDLEDYGVGLTALKNLLRSIPNTRERVLKACSQRFEERPALPLAEFLIEHFTAESRLDEAFAVASRLQAEPLKIFARKTTLKHRSLLATPSTPGPAIRQSHYTQLAVSHAAGDGASFAESARGLLGLEEPTPLLPELTRQEAKNHRDSLDLALALGYVLCAFDQVAEGAQTLVRACRTKRDEALPALEHCRHLEPTVEERGQWLNALGDLAWIAERGQSAAAFYQQAADVDPSLREALLKHLDGLELPEDREARSALVRLQLRLLVVLEQLQRVPAIIEQIREESLASEDELRTLLGERTAGKENRPTPMLLILAEASLRAGDLPAAASHIAEIPEHEEPAMHKVLAVMEKLRPEDENTEPDLDWWALLAVLRSRVQDADGACRTLRELWSQLPHAADTLFAITRNVLERVEPTPALVSAYVPPSLRAGMMDEARELVERILRHDMNTSELIGELTTILRDHRDLAPAVLDLLDGCDPAWGAVQKLRYPIALAALLSGQFDRALPEFSVLIMMEPIRGAEVLEHLKSALVDHPHEPQLNLAAVDLLMEADEFPAAAACLARALDASPETLADVIPKFDALVAAAPESSSLWKSYAEALYSIRRFDHLGQVCQRAGQHLGPEQMGEFRILQARMLLEEGKTSEALSIVGKELDANPTGAERALEILRDMIVIDPANVRVHLMLGDAATRSGNIDEALSAFVGAVRADANSLSAVEERLRGVAATPSVTGIHLIAIAGFYRRVRKPVAAADMYDRALQVDERLADRVVGELIPVLRDDTTDLSLMLVAARAARITGEIDRACLILQQMDARDPSRFENVLTEYRKLAEAAPQEIVPIHHAARILLTRQAPAAAVQLVVDASRNEEYELDERIAVLREFQTSLENDDRLALALTSLLRRAQRHDDAATLLARVVDGGDYDAEEAILVSTELIHDRPQHSELALLHHDVLVRLGRVEEALQILPEPLAVPRNHLPRLADRFAAHSRRTLADASLALRYAETLRLQDHIDDAIRVLRTAADRVEPDRAQNLWAELARLLHAADRTEEYRDVLTELTEAVHDRGRFFRMFEKWCLERLERETDSLRERLLQEPRSAEIRFELAERLLAQGRAHDVPEVLREDFAAPSDRARRAALLSQSYLEQHRADLAEASLRPVIDLVDPHTPEWDDLQLKLAECAGRLGRWAESHVHYHELIDRPSVGERAREHARLAYGHYLSDAAGEYCAVLSEMTSLDRGDREENP